MRTGLHLGQRVPALAAKLRRNSTSTNLKPGRRLHQLEGGQGAESFDGVHAAPTEDSTGQHPWHFAPFTAPDFNGYARSDTTNVR